MFSKNVVQCKHKSTPEAFPATLEWSGSPMCLHVGQSDSINEGRGWHSPKVSVGALQSPGRHQDLGREGR